jgi:prepilin-type N-terminal cleavage/methylation domain-containing protein
MKKAFSLIELSIVILIIGIIIAGVTQSSSLLRKAKIQSAQNLTKNSPVAGIEDLSLWVESTLPESFVSSQTEEGQLITQWNDINPQSTDKFYLTNSVDAPNFIALNQFYSESAGPGGLPSIYFDDTALGEMDLTNAPNGSIKVGSSKNNSGKETTFFVYKVISGGISNFYGRWYFEISPGGLYNFMSNIATVSGGTVSHDSEILSSTMGGSQFNLYINGSNTITATTTQKLYISEIFGFNGGSFYLSEIIIFDRILKDEERHSVEQYLGSKYGVNVAVTATPAVPSDITLKDNIKLVGKQNGFNVYEFNYKNDPYTKYRGVMAQEVLKIRPDAVTTKDGYLAVYYDRIGVDFKVVSKL